MAESSPLSSINPSIPLALSQNFPVYFDCLIPSKEYSCSFKVSLSDEFKLVLRICVITCLNLTVIFVVIVAYSVEFDSAWEETCDWPDRLTQSQAGVTIGDNTVIGAGSLVNNDVPASAVAVGNQCKVLRKITEDNKL